ncbi:MAG TPA: response regulator [Pseudolabrys sp.]|nr:response regulator [Pseudolabrys sp.]
MISETHSTNVVFVEDEPLIAGLISDVFTEHGFEVHAFPQAAEALRYIRSGSPVDVLFTDINLPGGMDGAELAEKARALRPELPIIYASGRYSPSELQPLVTRSVFVKKPYDPEDVCTLVTRMSGGGDQGSGMSQ